MFSISVCKKTRDSVESDRILPSLGKNILLSFIDSQVDVEQMQG